MKQQQVKTEVHKYEYIGYTNPNNEIEVNIPNNITKAVVYIGKDNNLKSYTHFYKGNITSNIRIHSEQTPNNVTTLNNPFIVTTYIFWGDGTMTQLTTSRTKNDIGEYKVDNVEYYIP